MATNPTGAAPDRASRLRRAGDARRSGFTFLELVLVVAVLGILFSIATVSFRGMTPKYRLRTAARNVASTMSQVRLLSVSRSRWMGIHYELSPASRGGDNDPPPFYRIIPPAPDDYPDQPIDEREVMPPEELPVGVRFRQVILADSYVVDSGTADVMFSPLGNAGSHIVVLEGEQGMLMSVKLNCITGLTDYFEGEEASFQHYED